MLRRVCTGALAKDKGLTRGIDSAGLFPKKPSAGLSLCLLPSQILCTAPSLKAATRRKYLLIGDNRPPGCRVKMLRQPPAGKILLLFFLTKYPFKGKG
jgi:hypothetical protein